LRGRHSAAAAAEKLKLTLKVFGMKFVVVVVVLVSKLRSFLDFRVGFAFNLK